MMYDYAIHEKINQALQKAKLDIAGKDNIFYTRCIANTAALHALFYELYQQHPKAAASYDKLIHTITQAYQQRPALLKNKDEEKEKVGHWYLSHQMAGMSLYVDRFCGDLKNLQNKLEYFQELGVNLLHLMPLFESPEDASDGGYAVSDFRKVAPRFGDLQDLKKLQQNMQDQHMYLMLDIVLNHTSDAHKWAKKARAGDAYYQDFFYLFDDHEMPSIYEQTMPDIFPESSPGSFTYNEEMGKWVMTVFHHYQWDLNYTNPEVFLAMLENIFFYANIGVDVLRIDAPAFIWKQLGTSCQNLPKAHTLLRLIRQCVAIATPGMALLGEAIVAPKEIMQYFGIGAFTAYECDLAYNATHMALQWDALATNDTRVMFAAQPDIQQKPFGTSWINYTRCHDDIGLGYEDRMIEQAGFNPHAHRSFIKDFYSGRYPDSFATGALFSFNPKTFDARISGSLASLCGLEKAILAKDDAAIDLAIKRIIMMQAHSFFLGGIPMLYYGDAIGYTNDYSYLEDAGKSYDNRWLHRPVIDWNKNARRHTDNTIEQRIFSLTQRLLTIRSKLPMVADVSNIQWLTPHNNHVAGFVRSLGQQRLYCIYNFSAKPVWLTWYAFKEIGNPPVQLFDHWNGTTLTAGEDTEFLTLEPYGICLLEQMKT